MRRNRIAATAAAAALALIAALVALAATGTGSPSYGYGSGMMGSGYPYRPSKAAPVRDMAAARADAQKFADRLGLKVDEVLQFKDNFYTKLVDSSGNGATEVLVDPPTGLVSIEYGPAMMWNTRYGMGHAAPGMMGSYGASMMRGYGGATTAGPSYGYGMMGGSGYGYGSGSTGSGRASSTAVTMVAAHSLAQRWLDSSERGVKVETGGDVFPGYYTLETLRDGKIMGMISVNATTGAVWPHWWHGAFIASSRA